MGIARSTTPISNTKSSEDADAAELMLYLATSPSPARPTTSSMPRRTNTTMGRILFAGAGEGEDSAATSASGSGSGYAAGGALLSGAGSSSFTSPTGRSGRSHHMHPDGDGVVDMMDIDDRGDGVATPILTFSQSSQESAASVSSTSSSSVLAPPPPLLRSPALPFGSPTTKSSSAFGASRKLFIDGEDTRRIMGLATGTYSSSPSPSPGSQPPHNRDGSANASNNINRNTTNANSSGGFTLGKGIDLVEAK